MHKAQAVTEASQIDALYYYDLNRTNLFSLSSFDALVTLLFNKYWHNSYQAKCKKGHRTKFDRNAPRMRRIDAQTNRPSRGDIWKANQRTNKLRENLFSAMDVIWIDGEGQAKAREAGGGQQEGRGGEHGGLAKANV